MQGSELKMWEGEWEFWGQQGLNVVSYNGSAAARNVIAEHELWLAPGCLDGRAPKRVTADMPHKVSRILEPCNVNFIVEVFAMYSQKSCGWWNHADVKPWCWSSVLTVDHAMSRVLLQSV